MSMSAYRVALIDLVSLGQRDEVRKLIKAGCDVNEQTDLAVNREDIDLIQLLIDNGAKVDLPDSFGRTPMSCAIKNGNKDVIKLLESQRSSQAHTNDDEIQKSKADQKMPGL